MGDIPAIAMLGITRGYILNHGLLGVQVHAIPLPKLNQPRLVPLKDDWGND